MVAEQRRDQGAGGKPQQPDRHIVQVLVFYRVDEHFKIVFRQDAQWTATVGHGTRGYLYFQPAGHEGERAALNQQRHQHHRKGDIKVERRVFDSANHWKNGEHDRNGSAQADPGNEEGFAPTEFEKGFNANQDGQRASNEDQRQRNEASGQGHVPKLAGRHQQSQHQEQANLAQPGQTIVYGQDEIEVAAWLITNHQAR